MSSFKRAKLANRQETRNSDRNDIRLIGLCRIGERPAAEAVVIDISAEGCELQLVSIGVTKMEPVELQLGAEAPIMGLLKWAKQGALGVGFNTPLADDVVERLIDAGTPDNVVAFHQDSER
ncbi:MAG: hypothetical protein ABIT16_01090 [Croceibacterium sp.]